MEPIKIEEVFQAYSGKDGCACGCNGNHRVNPNLVAEAFQRRGYSIQSDEISMRSVKYVVNLMNKNLDKVEICSEDTKSLELNGRLYIVHHLVKAVA